MRPYEKMSGCRRTGHLLFLLFSGSRGKRFFLHLVHVFPVNGGKVFFHGDRFKPKRLALPAELLRNLQVAVVPVCIIAQEHVCFAAVFDNIGAHGKVA